MRHIVSVFFVFLFLSCSTHRLPSSHGEPWIDLRCNSKIAVVGKVYTLKGTIWGDLTPGPVILIVSKQFKAQGDEPVPIAVAVGEFNVRALPLLHITFTPEDYYAAMGRIESDGFRSWVDKDSLGGDDNYMRMENDEGWVSLVLEIYKAEYDPYDSTKVTRGKIFVKSKLSVKLECYYCVV